MISDAAQRAHDELFPGHVSTLKVTDPELIEVFDNFAFDEVLQYGDLDTRTRLMVQLAAMIASQALSEYRIMLGAALTAGVTPVEVKEIVYQAVPYVGLAKVFDFLHTTNEVLVERDVQLPLPGQSACTPDTRAEVGRSVQNRIVGADKVARLILGLMTNYGRDAMTAAQPVLVNGELGLFIPGANGLPGSVTAVAVRDGRIVALHGVLNPEKLGTLRRQP